MPEASIFIAISIVVMVMAMAMMMMMKLPGGVRYVMFLLFPPHYHPVAPPQRQVRHTFGAGTPTPTQHAGCVPIPDALIENLS